MFPEEKIGILLGAQYSTEISFSIRTPIEKKKNRKEQHSKKLNFLYKSFNLEPLESHNFESTLFHRKF